MYRKLRNGLFFFFFKFFVKFKSPKLTAFLIFISLKKLKGIKKNNSSKKMMILEKSFGIEDLRSSFSKTKILYEPLIVQRKIFSCIFKLFFKNDELHDHFYITSNEQIEIKKIALRNFYTQILKELKNYIDLKIIVNFNFAYKAERELQFSSKINNIIFITNQKESNFLETERKSIKKLYTKKSGKFNGDLMIVYSERYKKLLIGAGIVKKDNIICVGLQRADRFFIKGKNSQNYILFFLIQVRRGPTFQIKKTSLKFWSDQAIKATKATINVAKKYPNVKFIFKARIKNEKYSIIQRELIKKENLNNCKIVLGGDSFEYIKNSKLIIGMNSTSLMEGLAAKKKILVPYFNINNKFKKNNLMKLSKPIIRARNTREFEKILTKIIKEKSYVIKHTKNSKRQLKYHIGNDDGKSYKRFANIINNIE